MEAATAAVVGYLEACAAGEPAREWQLSGTGPVAELEAKLRRLYGKRYALCVSSATTGLIGLGMALELDGAEFVTTPYTYGATLAPWLFLNCRPRFADITPTTLTIDPTAARHAGTPRTRAILAADIHGVPCDTRALRAVADELGCWLIVDGAQSFSAMRGGMPAGAFADALVVSFNSQKQFWAGEGGAVLMDNQDLYEKLLWETQHCSRQRRELGLHLDNEFALNGRINPLSAVWANAVFDDVQRAIEDYRRQCFEVGALLNRSGLTVPTRWQEEGIVPSFFRLTFRWAGVPDEASLAATLRSSGYEARISPSPIRLVYQQSAFLTQFERRTTVPPDCPVAEVAAARSFCLDVSRSADEPS